MRRFRFSPALPQTPAFTLGDGLIILGIAAFLYIGTRLAFHAPATIHGPDISLSPLALPWYALLSVGRMTAAYFLSMLFSLFYGYAAARNRGARTVLMPLLDILQSVPILSFLPVVLLGLTSIMPQALAAELTAIVLIFTSQAWNITFSFYQSMTTIPMELREAAAIFRLDPWARFKTLELPFAAIGLLWNSMMSWSGGWFFLMAAEIFRVGTRDFRLPGLGSYLQAAANAGSLSAVLAGLGTLVFVIVMLDQFVWRPLTAWTDKFKVDMLEADYPPSSWFAHALSRSWLVDQCGRRIWNPFSEWIDGKLRGPLSSHISPPESLPRERPSFVAIGVGVVFVLLILYGAYRAAAVLITLPAAVWSQLGVGLLATCVRVAVSLIIALIWTVPVGVLIGTNRRVANILHTLILPALFPFIVTGSITASGGAWNASIVAEHVEFGGRTFSTTGIGALIAQATGVGDYSLLLAGTLALVLAVVLINRLFWQKLYRIAEERYRME